MYADYCQFEWRIAAALSQDPALLDVLNRVGFDLYREVAAALTHVSSTQVGAEFRASVKDEMMHFLFSPQRHMTIHSSPLSKFLATTHPHLLEWLQLQESAASQTGVVQTPFGRKIALESGDRAAVNNLIQATAADIFKHALLAVDRALPSGARILLPLHDAFLIDCLSEEVHAVRSVVFAAMTTPLRSLPVRLEVEDNHTKLTRAGETDARISVLTRQWNN